MLLIQQPYFWGMLLQSFDKIVFLSPLLKLHNLVLAMILMSSLPL